MSYAVVEWLDVFTRLEYKQLIIENLQYCQNNKGMEIIAWCLMTNHLHLIFRSVGENTPGEILRDFKKHTSKEIVNAIKENPKESRKEFLLLKFREAAQQCANAKQYQFWRHDNKPIELWSNNVIAQKVNYIHQNPVEAGLVYRAEDYPYSSATDYAGEKGLLGNIVIADLYLP